MELIGGSSGPGNTSDKTRGSKKKKEKLVITGDDILIEYVRRIKNATKKSRN